ncbi:hypothetical protein BX666DRAFT_1956109 [Dichotomocladium elegans]|nr:hypothetical protein BX666DRAFT_1956109 [Dichotomocladium elegans]
MTTRVPQHNIRSHQQKQKRAPIPYSSESQHLGEAIHTTYAIGQASTAPVAIALNHTTSIGTNTAIPGSHSFSFHHKHTGSADLDSSLNSSMHHQQQSSDPAFLSANPTTKDKKKTLFRFGKRKAPTSPANLNVAPSGTLQGNASSVSLGGHSFRHHHHDYEARQPHPLDVLGIDEPGRRLAPYGRQRSAGSSSIGQRKDKDREHGDASYISDLDNHPRGSTDLPVDQDFATMEGTANPDYYNPPHPYQISGYAPTQNQEEVPTEMWLSQATWDFLPAERSISMDVAEPSVYVAETSEVEECSSEAQKYEAPKKNYCIRIFRQDGTFATLQLPLNITAESIVERLAVKLFVHDKSKLGLTLRRQNLERLLQASERPLQIQKTLFEHMGYTEEDNIEDVGREDNSYLLRFVFGPSAPQPIQEEFDYSDYQHIDLQARNLRTIPLFLYQHAPRVVSLDLSKNLLMDIPLDFIQSCRSLESLWLANNDYSVVPSSIRFVRMLENLNISGNRIHDLHHAHFEEITGLKTLRIYNNRLSSLPNTFSTFKQLTSLYMSNNDFTEFPRVICDIISLTFLDISFNKIQEFPDEISNLVNLSRFFAVANRFSGSIPASFAKLENLQELDIRQNHITDLEILSRLPRLEILVVDYNAVSIVSYEFTNLRQFQMKKNHLTQFSFGGSRRPSYDSSNLLLPTAIISRQQEALLTDLNLSNCMLSSLPEDIFASLPLLQRLDLDCNTLITLPSSIGALRKLVTLSIQSNKLETLPSEISKLGELKTLDAQKNNLRWLPPDIWLCASLQELNCSSNLLETFPKPYTSSGAALHLPIATDTEDTVVGNAKIDAVLPKPLGGHLGQGIVPGASRHNPQVGDIADNVHSANTIQSSPNFNPPSFFASPHNHPPPLSLSLRKLFLGDNRLSNEVWSPLMLFLELRTLNLSFNDLDEVPPEHLCHQHLYELYLSGNRLTSLPADDIEKLSFLRVLAINGNKLQTLPAEIGKLRKLLVLDVGNNVLKYNIANWPYDWNWNWNLSLKFLNLSGNKRLEIKKTHPEIHGPKEKDLADFSALTRLRMLGLMDITILGVSTPEESQDRRVRTSPSEVNNMAYGVADWLGSNDHLSTWDLVMPRFRNKDNECIFGLFDGRKSTRSGCKLTKYLNDQLTSHVESELNKLKSGDTVVSALRRSFLSLEKGLGADVCDEKDSGASAIVCYIAGTKLYVANVGDAIAVISRNNGQAFEITHNHISLNPSEISRIRSAGGFVSHTGRLNNELRISRGFGYFDLIPAVNANPYVATIELNENDEFVIMASPGLWERMSHQTAVDVARTEKDDLMAAAQKLRDFAITYGAERDLMVMVIGVGDLFDKRDKRNRLLRGYGRGGGGADVDDGPIVPGNITTPKNKRRGKEEGPGDTILARLDREIPPPLNQVALVFTDIKGSTFLWETQPENMRSAIKTHDTVMRRTLRSVGGYEVKTEGDAFMVCFQTITSALLWCFTVQLQLLEADWPAGILATDECREIDKNGTIIYRGLSVRMGIHWGTPVVERNPVTSRMDYFGPVVNKASRICTAADGGQVCVSSDVVAALRNIPGILEDNSAANVDDANMTAGSYLLNRDIQQLKRLGFRVMELGMRRLKGLETPEMLSLVYPQTLAGRMEPDQLLPIEGETKHPPPELSISAAEENIPASPCLRTSEVSCDGPLRPEDVPSLDVDSEATVAKPPGGETGSRAVDPIYVQALASVALRLEKLTTKQMFGSLACKSTGLTSQGIPGPRRQSASSKIQRMVEKHIMSEAGDEELLALLDNFVARTENAVSALYLHKVGHFTTALEKLGEAVDLDPTHILRALQMYSEVAGLAERPAGLGSAAQYHHYQ